MSQSLIAGGAEGATQFDCPMADNDPFSSPQVALKKATHGKNYIPDSE